MSDGTLPVKVHLSDEEHFVWSLISTAEKTVSKVVRLFPLEVLLVYASLA